MSDFLSRLNEIDSTLFLLLNGMHNQFFDYVMFWASNRWIWIPFYAWLLFRIYKLFGKKTITVIVLTALLITASDQLSSNVIKNVVQRPRPCHEASLEGKVHLVNNYCGGPFGFVSSHAANCFALLSFLFLLVRSRDRLLMLLLAAWAILVSYSRIYLGAHYPGDVICGAMLGFILGTIFSIIYFKTQKKLHV
jgi:undecaprenyl-diphosphatase